MHVLQAELSLSRKNCSIWKENQQYRQYVVHISYKTEDFRKAKRDRGESRHGRKLERAHYICPEQLSNHTHPPALQMDCPCQSVAIEISLGVPQPLSLSLPLNIQFNSPQWRFSSRSGRRRRRAETGSSSRLSRSTIRFVSECHFLFRIFAFYLLHLREHCCCESQFESFVRYVLHSTPHRRCVLERDKEWGGERKRAWGKPFEYATPLTIHIHVHVGMYIWASCPGSGSGLGQWESRKLPADLARNFFHFFSLSFAISFVTHAISPVSRECVYKAATGDVERRWAWDLPVPLPLASGQNFFNWFFAIFRLLFICHWARRVSSSSFSSCSSCFSFVEQFEKLVEINWICALAKVWVTALPAPTLPLCPTVSH